MSEFKQTFNSSLGKKLIMALTGLFLCTFLIVHLGGNLLLFKNDNGFGFNVYANFLTHFPPIEVIAYILYLSILVHALYAIILTVKNRKARPVGYAVAAKSDTSWSSKNMGLLGSILFVFLVIHMSDFWYKYKYTNEVAFKEYRTDLATDQTTVADYTPVSADFNHSVSTENNVEIVRVKDLHARVAHVFGNIWYVLIYVIAMGALSFHLLHGFQSAFRTLGWVHRKYTPIVYGIGAWFFAVIIPLGFALMPVYYFFMHKG
ncbi:succinate dehydrogenase / fumarate reductase cytochrome b subunit [Mucilaginibacter lappiensis]|uniref:Succinate dehydrogenase / fumarate reductase cytochrome b subunit n=1 Tax=Mucilaginibacter lappiensis TaxID=354630 RepID=A0ABR6PF95_9SPHI|nr:succinate dehydrogenase cytochrome b subunit [Mucilaginibacter lappiensis]MBB6108437.1 succinate dehydrogenase / fumarate reductase cytochrome b subunit [Mucilaginibacter lappiensis]SIQ38013.1 succinate dehydrogenase / fumarate reductase cytochrome b subunit [Mucilaginibacter lappiensis]